MQTSVEAAHEHLLAISPGDHAAMDCPICVRIATETDPEVAVTAKTYTESEYHVLAADEVERATATLTNEVAELTTKISDLQAQLDAAEAAAETATAALAQAKQEHEDYLTAQAAEKEKAELAISRTSAIREANPALTDAYITDERVSRWSELSTEAFDAVLDSVRESANAVRAAAAVTESATDSSTTRETAAFAGGAAPTSTATAADRPARRFLATANQN